ncbi:MAG: HAD-IC family P-type ATPase, partial [Bacilli bacterium]
SDNEVTYRVNNNLVNYDTTTPSKTVKEIIIENTFTLFNVINLILALAVILVGSYKNLLFLGVVVCNALISSIQEIRAKKAVDKLSFIASSKVKVIRNGKEKQIGINELVLDDIVLYELGDQIITDSIVRKGTIEVDESFITGESKTIFKQENDTILSGSFVVSGGATVQVKHVGLDNYTAMISKDAKFLKKTNSEIMTSLNKIVKYVSIVLIPIGILLLLRQFSIDSNTTENAVISTVAALIGMIPEGLILLVSTVLAISVIRLSKFNVLVQELYCIETLARVDTLCLDKTGTITEGIMEVYDVVALDGHGLTEIDTVLANLSANLTDKNPTFKAINAKYGLSSTKKASNIIPFSSGRKYSGATFDKETFIIGAPEFIIKKGYHKYENIINKYGEDNRVLALISTKEKLSSTNLPLKYDVMGLVLIRDKIRPEVFDTIDYFLNNGVELKIISGDSASSVTSIAKKVGIEIKGVCDFSTLDKDVDLINLVENTTIFARVKPDEKKKIICALKANSHIVAMTGDGVNDVLALKEADCGIAMSSGSDAARNVAELVLLDSNFNSMPHIVKEGRRTINNVERSASLFLSKTIYASLLAITFLFISREYPFIPIQMSLISGLTIGLPAFILALEPNYNKIKTSFFINILSNSIPGGLTTVINILMLIGITSLFK